MTFFPRPRSQAVSPLSPGVESLLRGLPRAAAGDATAAKISLLAAFERGRPQEGSGLLRTSLRGTALRGTSLRGTLRVAIPAGALAAGMVLAVGTHVRQSPADIGMARRDGIAAQAGIAEARLPVVEVERPLMPVLMSALGDDAP